MTHHLLSIASLVSLLGATTSLAPATAQDPGRFPPLPTADRGVVRLPLGDDGGLRWRAVGDATTVTPEGDGLAVAYRRAGRAAFGAAIAFRPGGLTGLDTLVVEFGGGGKGATVLVSIRNAAGGVHSWTALRLDGDARIVRLDVADIAPDAFQNEGRRPGAFDASQAVILSVTDIAGYFGGKREDVRWTLTAVRAELEGAAAAPAADDGRLRPTSAGAQQFVAALVTGEDAPDAALPTLLAEAMQRPGEPSTYLWLGLNQLWLAAEGDRSSPRTIEHVVLADWWFDRFAATGGRDPRVPSWSVPAKLSVDNAFDVAGEGVDLVEPLRDAWRNDPGFHGFALGLVGFTSPTDSGSFRTGLEAVRSTFAVEGDDPSVRNEPNWPHNVEGFLLFAADYEHRAGNGDRARALLDRIERVDEFASWPFRDEVGRRREAWERGEEIAHRGGWMAGRSCVICHRR